MCVSPSFLFRAICSAPTSARLPHAADSLARSAFGFASVRSPHLESCVLYDRHKERRERAHDGQDLLLDRLLRALRWLWMGSFARKCIRATIIKVSTSVQRYA